MAIRVTGSESAELVSPIEMRELSAALGCQTQAELAQVLGITQGRISQILSGKHPVRRGALLTLIRQLQAQTIHKKNRG
jgi:transcriptional regulator with XRE-family HTH domain